MNGKEVNIDDFPGFGGGGGGKTAKNALKVFTTNEFMAINEDSKRDFDFRRNPFVVVFASKENNE